MVSRGPFRKYGRIPQYSFIWGSLYMSENLQGSRLAQMLEKPCYRIYFELRFYFHCVTKYRRNWRIPHKHSWTFNVTVPQCSYSKIVDTTESLTQFTFFQLFVTFIHCSLTFFSASVKWDKVCNFRTKEPSVTATPDNKQSYGIGYENSIRIHNRVLSFTVSVRYKTKLFLWKKKNEKVGLFIVC